MSIRTTTKNVVRNWASVPAVNNTLIELCVIWATGNPSLPCSPALPVLIGDLKQAFPTKNLDGLRPSDMTGGGSIKTVEALISFIASSPSRSFPFALVSTKALAQLESVERGSKKRAGKSAKKSAKKGSKGTKASTKQTKRAGKKGRKRGAK